MDDVSVEAIKLEDDRVATVHIPVFVYYLPEISSEITLKQHERANHVTITMNTNKSISFLSYLYKDSTENVRLDRKYEAYVKTVVNNDRKTR